MPRRLSACCCVYGQKREGNYIENVYASDGLFTLPQSYSAAECRPGLIKNADLVVLREGRYPTFSGLYRRICREFVRQGGRPGRHPTCYAGRPIAMAAF